MRTENLSCLNTMCLLGEIILCEGEKWFVWVFENHVNDAEINEHMWFVFWFGDYTHVFF